MRRRKEPCRFAPHDAPGSAAEGCPSVSASSNSRVSSFGIPSGDLPFPFAEKYSWLMMGASAENKIGNCRIGWVCDGPMDGSLLKVGRLRTLRVEMVGGDWNSKFWIRLLVNGVQGYGPMLHDLERSGKSPQFISACK